MFYVRQYVNVSGKQVGIEGNTLWRKTDLKFHGEVVSGDGGWVGNFRNIPEKSPENHLVVR